jgi:hypothetical protein
MIARMFLSLSFPFSGSMISVCYIRALINRTIALSAALSNGDIMIARLLLGKGADVETSYALMWLHPTGATMKLCVYC